MQKWIMSTLLGFIMQGAAMVMAVDASQFNGSVNAAYLQGEQILEKTERETCPRRPHHHHHHCSDPCNIPGPVGPIGFPGAPGAGFGRFASYWLTNQPSLVGGQNILFNLQQTLSGIVYDPTTGIFTLPPGVYFINFFATPNQSFVADVNLNVNGTIIPNPNLEGASIVVDLTAASNTVSVQATGTWSPQTGDIGSFFFAYASIAIYQIGS